MPRARPLDRSGIRDVGLGHWDVGAHDPGDDSRQQENLERTGETEHDIRRGGTEEPYQEQRTPAVVVREGSPYWGEQELHR